jgi:predicted aldo/keto reductase-like oxidoreductase
MKKGQARGCARHETGGALVNVKLAKVQVGQDSPSLCRGYIAGIANLGLTGVQAVLSSTIPLVLHPKPPANAHFEQRIIMQYRIFPKIPDQPVSILGFGCMRLPVLDGSPEHIDEPRATRLLRDAIDAGVNYIDTAYPYHNGRSETFLGHALRGGCRERIQLATKCPTWLVQSEADWERFLEQQLSRLETDMIDFYLIHALNGELWETVKRFGGLQALDRARRDGRISHAGFSFHGSPAAFAEILEGYDWEFCQIQFNFLDVNYQAGTEGLRRATARGIGVIAMEPLRGGVLAAVPPDPVQAVWARFKDVRSPAEWAWRWVWHHPEVITALSGMNTEDQLRENLALADVVQPNSLAEEELSLIAEVRAYFLQRMRIPCTTCGYCLPCPNGVAIPDVFSMVNTAAMFEARDATSRLYRFLLVSRGQGADACNECGECVQKCPQAIPIPERLSEAHKLLFQK